MRADTLIVDGRHALWRTSDAFKELSAEVGDEIIGTGGMYGFLCLMIRIHQKYGGRTVIAWEGKSNFRRKLYPEYKRKGEIEPEQLAIIEDMAEQERRLKGILRRIGVEQYHGIDCEADDVIGRLSKERSQDGNFVIIYSGDSDLRQLVDENVYVASPGYRGAKDVLYDQERVLAKHEVAPGYIADLKALAGDTSDNIPGIKNIGPKTAAKLINAYGDVEGVINAATETELTIDWPVSGRFRATIEESAGDIRLFKELTTIRRDLPMRLIEPKRSRKMVKKHFRAYHFSSLLASSEMTELMRLA